MTSKYACFDIGDVLVHVNFDPFLDAISKYQNISHSDAWHFLSRTQKLHDLGLTTLRDELTDHFSIRSEVILQEILNCWESAILPEEVMMRLISDLIENDVKVALLSNIGFEHMHLLNKTLAPLKGWKESLHFFSCEVGARKPSMLYYQSFLTLHPKFRGAFYIDDRQENLDTSKTFGFRTIRFVLSELMGKNTQVRQQKIREGADQLKNLILD